MGNRSSKRIDPEKVNNDTSAVDLVNTTLEKTSVYPWAQRPVFISGQSYDHFDAITARLNGLAPEQRPSVIYNVFFFDNEDTLLPGVFVAIK